MTSLLFVARKALAWVAAMVFVVVLININPIPINRRGQLDGLFWFGGVLVIAWVAVRAISHVHRVRSIAGRVDPAALANRQRRQIEIPFETGEAFDIVDAAIRELAGVRVVERARESLLLRAETPIPEPSAPAFLRRWLPRRNLIQASVAPSGGACSVTLVCEPDGNAMLDWFRVDDGLNLENAEIVARAITRRVAERRRSEQASAAQTGSEKELAVAKLNLLHAQIEPHFLYNTLASAQILTRSDPARADEMLGNLISYLRNSLPKTENEPSTLGVELERARAYLDILKIRMGARLSTQIEVPEALRSAPFPAMMLQTLVENAIKHGLEPKYGGGTIWIIARESGGSLAVTVADDGQGFNAQSSGTGIGLKNLRERLKLAYGADASFVIAANFPNGVAATITLPVTATAGADHA
jgi:hypothetical protein